MRPGLDPRNLIGLGAKLPTRRGPAERPFGRFFAENAEGARAIRRRGNAEL